MHERLIAASIDFAGLGHHQVAKLAALIMLRPSNSANRARGAGLHVWAHESGFHGAKTNAQAQKTSEFGGKCLALVIKCKRDLF